MQFIPAIIAAGATAVEGEQQKRAQAQTGAQFDAQGRAARQTGVVEEEAVRRRNAAEMGRMRAAAAEGGFDPSSGTLADLQSRTAGELELDALTARYKGQLEGLGLEYQGSAARAQGSMAQQNSLLRASAIVGGEVAKDYLRRNQLPTGG